MFGSNRITILILILLIIVALVLGGMVKRQEVTTRVPDDHQEQVVTESETAADTVKFSPIPPQQGERISYGAALRAFVGATIQFDAQCHAKPLTMSVESRSQILLDNQSSAQRAIIVGDRIYTIPAYDFAIITMKKSGSYPVSCDETDNVAIVGVE